jgi:hypothetical protein
VLKKLLTVSILILLGSSVLCAQNKKTKAKADGEQLITDMARSRNMPPVVGDLGVFSNTLLDEDAMPPEVKRILDQKEKALPLLIAHLDDMRPTRMINCCNENPVLTVGDACLNMLSVIVRPAEPMFDKACVAEQDNQSFCLDEDYQFTMSSFVRRGNRRVPNKEVLTAKRNWMKAYRENKIQFKGY